ncbi:MAG: type II toxin-antitoxin system HicB family antitoxin, partial [Anaerolineales bacterium]
HINIFFSEEDGGYIADIPDLQACSAFGATPEEALAQVEIAKKAWPDAARAEGKGIPKTRC